MVCQVSKGKQHQLLAELPILQTISTLTQWIYLLPESMVTALDEEDKIKQVWLPARSELYHHSIMTNNQAIQKSI